VALDVLADQLLHSTFLQERFDRERLVVFQELKQRDDTPSVRAFDEFINLVFRVSPLRRHPSGTIDSVQAIPISTILSYRAARYISGNMAIAASGNIRHDEAVAKIEAAFADLQRGPRAERPPVPEPPHAAIERREIGDGTRSAEIRLGWSAPGDDHPDSPAMFILNDLLDATGRRLAEEIRDRQGLASSVGSDYLPFSDAGALMLSASTSADRVDEVVNLMQAQIQRLREGDVTDEEVQASLRANAGRRALEEEPNQNQTERADTEVSGTLDSFAEYEARLGSVTAADVQRVAQTYLGPNNYVLIIVRS
jgi:predicted Zn-dependent peptidase